jgi:hypothetical protein
MDPSKPPTHRTDQLEYVDALRGFALIGVLGANLFIVSGFSYITDTQREALPTAGLDDFVYSVRRQLLARSGSPPAVWSCRYRPGEYVTSVVRLGMVASKIQPFRIAERRAG